MWLSEFRNVVHGAGLLYMLYFPTVIILTNRIQTEDDRELHNEV